MARLIVKLSVFSLFGKYSLHIVIVAQLHVCESHRQSSLLVSQLRVSVNRVDGQVQLAQD